MGQWEEGYTVRPISKTMGSRIQCKFTLWDSVRALCGREGNKTQCEVNL